MNNQDTKKIINLNKILQKTDTCLNINFNELVLEYQEKLRTTANTTPYAIVLYQYLDIYKAFKSISKLSIVCPETLHISECGTKQNILHKICEKTVYYQSTGKRFNEHNVIDDNGYYYNDDATSFINNEVYESPITEDDQFITSIDLDNLDQIFTLPSSTVSRGTCTIASSLSEGEHQSLYHHTLNIYYFYNDLHGIYNIYQTYLFAQVLRQLEIFNPHCYTIINSQDDYGSTPLQYATENGNLSLMCHLLNMKADPRYLHFTPDKIKSNPTFIGNQIFNAFNKLYHNLNENNGSFTPVLFVQIIKCFTRVFPFMGNIDSMHLIHFEPLNSKIWMQDWNLKNLYILYVRCIISNCINFVKVPVISKDTFTVIMEYLNSSNSSLMVLLLNEIFKLYPNYETSLVFNEMTILHMACYSNSTLLFQKCFNEFKKQYLNINVRDGHDKTPLQYAIKNGNLYFTTKLIMEGADVNNLKYEKIPKLTMSLFLTKLAISVVFNNYPWSMKVLVKVINAIRLFLNNEMIDYFDIIPEFPVIFKDTLNAVNATNFLVNPNTLDNVFETENDKDAKLYEKILARCNTFYGILYKYRIIDFNHRLINFIFSNGHSMATIIPPPNNVFNVVNEPKFNAEYYGNFNYLQFIKNHIRSLLTYITDDQVVYEFLSFYMRLHKQHADPESGRSFLRINKKFVETHSLTVDLVNFAFEYIGMYKHKTDDKKYSVLSLKHMARNVIRYSIFHNRTYYSKYTSLRIVPAVLIEKSLSDLPSSIKRYISFCTNN